MSFLCLISSTEICTFFYPPTQVAQAIEDMMDGFGGKIDMGELLTREQSAGRLLSQAVYARWEK